MLASQGEVHGTTAEVSGSIPTIVVFIIGEFQSFPDFVSYMRPDYIARLIIADDLRLKDEYKESLKPVSLCCGNSC